MKKIKKYINPNLKKLKKLFLFYNFIIKNLSKKYLIKTKTTVYVLTNFVKNKKRIKIKILKAQEVEKANFDKYIQK